MPGKGLDWGGVRDILAATVPGVILGSRKHRRQQVLPLARVTHRHGAILTAGQKQRHNNDSTSAIGFQGSANYGLTSYICLLRTFVQSIRCFCRSCLSCLAEYLSRLTVSVWDVHCTLHLPSFSSSQLLLSVSGRGPQTMATIVHIFFNYSPALQSFERQRT